MFFLRFMIILFQEIKADIKNPEKPTYSFSGKNHKPLVYAGISSIAISGSFSETQLVTSQPSSFNSSLVNFRIN